MLGLGHAKPGWGSSGDGYFQVSRFVWVQDSGWLSGHPHSWATSVFCCLGLVSCLKAQAGCCGSGFYQEIAGVIQYSLKHWPVKQPDSTRPPLNFHPSARSISGGQQEYPAPVLQVSDNITCENDSENIPTALLRVWSRLQFSGPC